MAESEDKAVAFLALLWVENIGKVKTDGTKGKEISKTHACVMSEVAELHFAGKKKHIAGVVEYASIE